MGDCILFWQKNPRKIFFENFSLQCVALSCFTLDATLTLHKKQKEIKD